VPTKEWTVNSVSEALNYAVTRGDIKGWSRGYTGHTRARVFFDVEYQWGSHYGPQTSRFSLDEAHAFLHGLMTARYALAREAA